MFWFKQHTKDEMWLFSGRIAVSAFDQRLIHVLDQGQLFICVLGCGINQRRNPLQSPSSLNPATNGPAAKPCLINLLLQEVFKESYKQFLNCQTRLSEELFSPRSFRCRITQCCWAGAAGLVVSSALLYKVVLLICWQVQLSLHLDPNPWLTVPVQVFAFSSLPWRDSFPQEDFFTNIGGSRLIWICLIQIHG